MKSRTSEASDSSFERKSSSRVVGLGALVNVLAPKERTPNARNRLPAELIMPFFTRQGGGHALTDPGNVGDLS